MNPTHNSGIDIGIRYNVIPNLNKYTPLYEEEHSMISYISNSINADYYSFYIGWTINFD